VHIQGFPGEEGASYKPTGPAPLRGAVNKKSKNHKKSKKKSCKIEKNRKNYEKFGKIERNHEKIEKNHEN
jgi:hypothetical protein